MGKRFNGQIRALLAPSSKAFLLEMVPPVHKEEHASHITVANRPLKDDPIFDKYKEGEEILVFAMRYAEDERGQAVVVEGIERNDGKIPHVTISCAEGTKPVYSNELLLKGHEMLPEVFSLNVKIEVIKYE